MEKIEIIKIDDKSIELIKIILVQNEKILIINEHLIDKLLNPYIYLPYEHENEDE